MLICSQLQGDDQSVCTWCTETFTLEQVLHFEHWGQVTSLAWISQDQAIPERHMALSVGGARGGLSICPLSLDPFVSSALLADTPPHSHRCIQWFQWKEVQHSFEFPQNDAVEKQAYDPLNNWLVAGSYAGTIKMFSL